MREEDWQCLLIFALVFREPDPSISAVKKLAVVEDT